MANHQTLENEMDSLTVLNSGIANSSFNCCDLSGTKMNDVNLTGLNISDANLSELVIDGAQWGGSHFRHIGYGNPSRPELEQNTSPVQFTECNLQQGMF